MADIKQAARWMGEGKKVGRPSFDDICYFYAEGEFEKFIYFKRGDDGQMTDVMSTEDLLAEDWEIRS